MNWLAVQVGNIFRDREGRIVYGSGTVTIIGVGTSTLSDNDERLASDAHLCGLPQRPFIFQSAAPSEIIFVKAPHWWRDLKPSQLSLVPSTSVFVSYSNMVLAGSTSYCNHIWRISISEFLVFVCISFVAVARENMLLSKAADPKILPKCCGVLWLLATGYRIHSVSPTAQEQQELGHVSCPKTFVTGVVIIWSYIKNLDQQMVKLTDKPISNAVG